MANLSRDLFESGQGSSEPRRIFTVSQVAQDIKLILETSFQEIWVEGEVSNFSVQPSGHFYFSLKDETAVLDAAMFARANREVKFKIENGLKVVCFGRISAYAPRSRYNIIVEKIEPKGIGSLQLALEQLKQKLEKEGLFSAEHKRPIPYLPAKIGVVTSLSGAAIKDILKVLDRRFSDIHIIISPAQVQGEGAKEDISRALGLLNEMNETLPLKERIEVAVVGRGGGSIEDLWAFNEEIVARAIYNSKIPVISAVGHERDWTISDLVADLRAPTPSVAAELVIPKKEDLSEKLGVLSRGISRAFLDIIIDSKEAVKGLLYRMDLGMQNVLRLSSQELMAADKKLRLLNPVALIQQYRDKVVYAARQIYVRIDHYIKLRDAEFKKHIEKLAGLSPLNILARGYSITFKVSDGQVIKEVRAVSAGDILLTRLHKGEVRSRVTETRENY